MAKEQRLALLSVYDKTGITSKAEALVDLGFTLLSSGGTATCLIQAGFETRSVSDLVGGGPILGHRVVTLSREIHAGLLAQDCDIDELEGLGIPWVELVHVGLYPTALAAQRPEADWNSINEMVDIGGPTMLVSASKGGRIVVGTEGGFWQTIEWLRRGEPDSVMYRRNLAVTAFGQVARYYQDAADYLGAHIDD